MDDITQLTQVRKIRGILSEDDELKATFELMIVLCNLLFKNASDELLEIIKSELCSELCES